MIKPTYNDYVAFLKEKKIKLTDVRIAILEIITTKSHFTINEVIDDVKAKLGAVNVMSIYNNITLLLNEHLLFANTFNGKNILYEVITPQLAHVKCDYCGEFIHLEENILDSEFIKGLEKLAAEHNVDMEHFKIELHGKCYHCKGTGPKVG